MSPIPETRWATSVDGASIAAARKILAELEARPALPETDTLLAQAGGVAS